MSDKPNGLESPDFEKITPAKIEISTRAAPAPDETVKPPASSLAKQHRFGIALVCMVLLAVLVFWLLPQVIEKPQLAAPAASTEVAAPRAAATAVSPWQEAQLSRERKAAQDILAEFLDQQFLLEEKRVDLWGAADFELAKAKAQLGDEAYREQAFTVAQQHYLAGVAILSDLVARAETVVSDYLARATAALEAGDSETARTAFELVLEVDPLNATAASGYARAETLDEVLMMVGKALSAEANNELDEALALLDGALEIDPDLFPAQRARPQVTAKIRERDFALAMSSGFAALEASRYGEAKQAFDMALKLKPGATEARDGLSQVSHELTQNRIAALQQESRALEAQEQWQAANQKYQAVLALDPSVVFAQQGVARTATRARLDQLLEDAISKPARLSESEVHREAQQLLKVAGTVQQPGARLQRQVRTLKQHLEAASKPVIITLNSDNLTDVTLYKVGHLGNFTSHELSLKPGIYALVGKRAGFRDVRKEFVVAHGESHGPVVIQCSERI